MDTEATEVDLLHDEPENDLGPPNDSATRGPNDRPAVAPVVVLGVRCEHHYTRHGMTAWRGQSGRASLSIVDEGPDATARLRWCVSLLLPSYASVAGCGEDLEAAERRLRDHLTADLAALLALTGGAS